MFCCALLCVHSSFSIISMVKKELIAFLFVFLLSRDCCMAIPLDAPVCLQFVVVVFPDHTLNFSKSTRFNFKSLCELILN